MRLSGLPPRRALLTRSPAKRSASRGEATPIRQPRHISRRPRDAPVRATAPQSAANP